MTDENKVAAEQAGASGGLFTFRSRLGRPGPIFEFLNSHWPLVLCGFALFYLGPAIPAGKAVEASQS